MCFYVQLLKVGSCTNNDKSVPNILLSFSASIQTVLFSEFVPFGNTTRERTDESKNAQTTPPAPTALALL